MLIACASILAILLVLSLADLSRLSADLERFFRRPHLLLAFTLVYSAAFALRALAWQALLATRLRPFPLFRILQAALFLNHLLPVKAGEAARVYLATKRGVPADDAVAATVVARGLDFASLLLLALVLLPLAGDRLGALQTLAGPGLIVVAAGAVLARLRVSRRPLPLPAGLRDLGERFRGSLRAISKRRMLLAAAWTLPSWVLEGVAVFAIARGVGLDLPLHVALAVTAFTILFQTFHFTPGGIGVYEASMTGALVLYGTGHQDALALALLAHSMKFVYAFAVGGFLATFEGLRLARPALAGLRTGGQARASRFEVVMARAWNILNEGKPFTPVFLLAVVAVLGIPHGLDAGYWVRTALALAALLPLFLAFYRFDFPLRLRAALWLYLAVFIAVFRWFDPLAVAVLLATYFAFTVGLWGTVYYRLRIGMPWSNGLRFWRLVLENPDTTSGNFLEQAPKLMVLVLAVGFLQNNMSWGPAAAIEAFTLGVALSALLLHQWFFTWLPATALAPARRPDRAATPLARRVIAIVIDGCRADRLEEAETPCIDRLRREGASFTNVSTVYPARTVTCFSSMLTGAPPRVHGMRSNFVPSLGVKCDSIFAVLQRRGRSGRLVGIAHLVDAFGEQIVRTVSAVMDNDAVDGALAARAKQVLDEERPDLLVLQLIAVDQTGHARGSYNREYLEKIEQADRVIGDFLDWCQSRGYLEGAAVLMTADHGQGIGIGGHGHLSGPERIVPCVFWGAGVQPGLADGEPRSIMDIAPTISHLLGEPPPEQSVGRALLAPGARPGHRLPAAVVIPVRNEAENLPGVLKAIPRAEVPHLQVIVVDDGSSDGSAEVARASGADIVLRYERNRGLGAALRTGLARAREMDARAAVYLDGDGEYDPREIPRLLAALDAGADYVLGSRFRGRRHGQRLVRLAGNLLLSAGLSVLCGRLVTDGQTGFRAFSSRALAVAEIVHDYNYAQVLTLDMLRKGMRMAEVPVTYRRRERGRSFISGQYLWRVPLGIARQLLRN